MGVPRTFVVAAAAGAAAAAARRISRAAAAVVRAARARAVAEPGCQRESARRSGARPSCARMVPRVARRLVRVGVVCGYLGLAFLSCALIDGSGAAPRPCESTLRSRLPTAGNRRGHDKWAERRKLACLDALGLRLSLNLQAKLSLLKKHSQQKQEALLSS